MFFKSLRAKILLVVLLSILLSVACTLVVCLIYYNNNKNLANDTCNYIAETHAERIDSMIHRLSDFSKNLSILGETFYNLNSKNHKRLDNAVFKAFSANDSDISFGGGIWYEPYKILSSQKRFCSYAYNKIDGCIMISDFESEQYDYLNQIWYTTTKNTVSTRNATTISVPYIDNAGSKELMITISTGIFDQNNNLIGVSTVDWMLNVIVNKLTAIKPTENSFVMFANKKYDFILVLNDIQNNIEEYVGKSLSTAKWYSPNLKNKSKFMYNGKEYITFVKPLDSGFVLFINVPTNELYSDIYALLEYIIIIFLLSIIIVFFIIFKILQTNIENPIQYLVTQSNRYVNGDFDIKFNLSSSKEFSVLASTFNNMISSIKEHVSNLTIANATKKNIEMELKIARTIQSSNLKKIFPPYPHRKEFDIFATMTPAKAVGGDFYDFFFLDDNHFAFLIADVSDKGIPAALFMMEAKSVIKNSLERTYSLKEAIIKANSTLCSSNEAGFFVTSFIAILNTENGTLEYVNAGHNKPLLKSSKFDYSFINTKGGIPLGVFNNINYTTYQIQLKAEDSIFLYTDGITDAQNNKKEFFGEQRLVNTLNNNTDFTAKGNIDSVLNDIKVFCNKAEQYDDMTMLNIIYTGSDKDKNVFVIKADVSSWDKVYDFLLQDMIYKQVPKEKQLKILLACEEIFVNIASYAYDNGGNAWIKTKVTDTEYTITFSDLGKKYNPLEKQDPNIQISLQDRQIGGLGIFLAKKTMDKIEYRYENFQNILTMSIKM